MNDYFTDEILNDLALIEEIAYFNWKVAHEANRPEEVEVSKPLPNWFKKKAP